MKGILLALLAGTNLSLLESRVLQETTQSQPSRNYLDFKTLESYIVPDNKVPMGYEDPLNLNNPLYHIAPILQAEPNIQLTRNFKLVEFARTGGNTLDYIRINPRMVDALQRLRDYLGKPVQIASAYRPIWRQEQLREEESTKDRAAKVSRHSSGNAVDIKVTGITAEELRKVVLETLGSKIKTITYEDSTAIHLDFSNY